MTYEHLVKVRGKCHEHRNPLIAGRQWQRLVRTQVDVDVAQILRHGLLLLAAPQVTTSFFSHASASISIMSSLVVKGHTYGKESATSLATGIRAILPLPSVMQILDVVLPSSLEPYLSDLFPAVPDCFIGWLSTNGCYHRIQKTAD